MTGKLLRKTLPTYTQSERRNNKCWKIPAANLLVIILVAGDEVSLGLELTAMAYNHSYRRGIPFGLGPSMVRLPAWLEPSFVVGVPSGL